MEMRDGVAGPGSFGLVHAGEAVSGVRNPESRDIGQKVWQVVKRQESRDKER